MKINNTKAAVLTSLNAPLEIWELSLPPLKPGQVLVEVAYSGLCHSQINEICGYKGEDRFLPHTLGHEGSGRVLAVGESVVKVVPGDHVVLSWIKGQGTDVPSAQYDSEQGKVNSGAISTFLTHAVISENRLIPIPKSMPLREAALLGCAIPTGAGVVDREMSVAPGKSFTVFGVGGVGLSALVAAKAAGADPIIAVDVQEEKLSRAQAMGATHLVNALQKDALKQVLDVTNGGSDFVFESAGKKEAMEQAFAAVKAPGTCVLAGNLRVGETIQIDPFDLIRGKRIVGTWGGKSVIDEDVKCYAQRYQEGKLPLAAMITHEEPLERINDLVEALKQGKVGRGLIKLGDF